MPLPELIGRKKRRWARARSAMVVVLADFDFELERVVAETRIVVVVARVVAVPVCGRLRELDSRHSSRPPSEVLAFVERIPFLPAFFLGARAPIRPFGKVFFR